MKNAHACGNRPGNRTSAASNRKRSESAPFGVSEPRMPSAVSAASRARFPHRRKYDSLGVSRLPLCVAAIRREGTPDGQADRDHPF